MLNAYASFTSGSSGMPPDSDTRAYTPRISLVIGRQGSQSHAQGVFPIAPIWPLSLSLYVCVCVCVCVVLSLDFGRGISVCVCV